MIFANQTDITNAKISYYIVHNTRYLCQSIEMAYEINICVTRILILSSLPNSGTTQIPDTQTNTIDKVCCRKAKVCSDSHASKTNSEWIFIADVLHDASFSEHVANYVTNITFVHWYSCSMYYYNYFAFEGSGICYFIPSHKYQVIMQLQPVAHILRTSIIVDQMLKEEINTLYFFALISAAIDIMVLTQASFIFASRHDQEENNGNKLEFTL